jgi:hypothetical protein
VQLLFAEKLYKSTAGNFQSTVLTESAASSVITPTRRFFSSKRHGHVAEFDFLRVLCGPKHNQIVWMPKLNPEDQQAQKQVDIITYELRSTAIEGITRGAL